MSRKRKEPIVAEGVRIEKMAAEGKCIGHLADERVVFVPFVAPGDVVDLRLSRRRRSYAEGTVSAIREYSPLRIEPRCEHFGLCGGCKWQHLPYQIQLEAKEQQVYDQLERIGHLTIGERRPILGAEETYYYRNKMEYTFSNRRWLTEDEVASDGSFSDPHFGWGLGFHIPGRFDKVLDIKACHLQADLGNKIRLFIRDYTLSHSGYDYFDLRQQEGLMRSLMIRISETTHEVMVVVVFYKEEPKLRVQLLEAIREAFPEITSLQYVLNPKANDSFGDLEVIPYSGADHIWEEMEGLRYKIGPKSFYQTNSLQAWHLYDVVRQLANLKGDELVYDLYTGTGTIASFVSRSARRVVGIEYVPEAIEDAWVNCEVNGLSNLDFYAGDMKDILTDDFVQEHGHPDLIITDPPRAGMHPDVVATLLRTAPERIIYVSCNPASQARDVAMMQEAYEVTIAQPVDMFPHTHHVENVLLLTRR